jgi:hypothetical protein
VSRGRERQSPEFNLLKKPGYGQPYLLSCTPQKTLIMRFHRQVLLAVILFFVTGTMLSWAIEARIARPSSLELRHG